MQKDINLAISCKITWFERSTIRRCSKDHFIKASIEFFNIYVFSGLKVRSKLCPLNLHCTGLDYLFVNFIRNSFKI